MIKQRKEKVEAKSKKIILRVHGSDGRQNSKANSFCLSNLPQNGKVYHLNYFNYPKKIITFGKIIERIYITQPQICPLFFIYISKHNINIFFVRYKDIFLVQNPSI